VDDVPKERGAVNESNWGCLAIVVCVIAFWFLVGWIASAIFT
jgi:hypothetical protein